MERAHRTVFTNSEVGKIQSNVAKVENKDIVIGMLQSISMKKIMMKVFLMDLDL